MLLSGGVLVATAIPIGNYFFGKIDYPESFARPNSLVSILDNNELKELGVAYRAQVADESKERTIAKLLLEKLPTDPSVFNAALEDVVKKDFADGNTIEVKGWILSRTEARQCALFSYSPTSSH